MLRIVLHQFRCWDNIDLEIPLRSVTLIRGNSGSGKTTIFHALTWCLYGNIRLVAPNHLETETGSKAKTMVSIEFPYHLNSADGILKIVRQKNPNRFIITHNQSTYEDKVAQSIVDDIFGIYDIWLASCYIGQGCRNSFLTAPNSGKMELLNSIAFHEEDPSIFIEKIDTAITTTDTEYKTKLATFNSNIATLTNYLQQVDMNNALSPEQLASLSVTITTLQNEHTKLTQVKRQCDIDIGILSNLKQQYATTVSRVITVPQPDPSLIKYDVDLSTDYDTTLSRLLNYIPLLQRRDDLGRELQKYSTLSSINPKPDRQYTMSDYQSASTYEMAYREGMKLAQSLGVQYNKDNILQAIIQMRSWITGQDRLRAESAVQTLQGKLQLLEREHNQVLPELVLPNMNPTNIPAPDYSQYNTTDYQNKLSQLSQEHGAQQMHIQHLQKARDVIQCPQCNGALRYQQGTLIAADTGPINQGEIIAATTKLNEITNMINHLNQTIQSLKVEESNKRRSYEQAILHEQRRMDGLKEQVRLIETERMRREHIRQTRTLQITQMQDEIKKAVDIVNSFPVYNGKLLSQFEVNNMHASIGKLEGLNVVEQPVLSSAQIQQYLQYQDGIVKQMAAMTDYNKAIENIPLNMRNEIVVNVRNYIDQLKQYWANVKYAAEEGMRLERLKISLHNQIEELTNRIVADPSERIAQITREIKDIQDKMAVSETTHKIIDFYNYVTKERDMVTVVNEKLSELNTFRQYAVDTECRILQEIVDSINASIQGVCSTLFDRDINISLSLFKTMKTSKSVKPVVNFQISYQGGVFDNINQMSGGEGDRASLALTLALNRLTSCPILMLDESLSSLDLNMKEAALQAIHENTNNTVLVIMHDGIEGIYDHVINVDELRSGGS